MHELGIANSVLEAVQAEAARRRGAVPVKVAVRIGELAGIDPDALSFSFEVLVAGTRWHRLELEIQTKPREHRCPSCGVIFRVVDYNFACSVCGTSRTECVGGDELELAYLELEEP
jgi:hydrogenase nickel incorporation protein HypA/HybF